MEVEHVVIKVVDDARDKRDSFAKEMAKGFFWNEIETKKEELKEYQDAFKDMDKDSFNAQNVEIIIDNLRAEIKQMQKQFS